MNVNHHLIEALRLQSESMLALCDVLEGREESTASPALPEPAQGQQVAQVSAEVAELGGNVATIMGRIMNQLELQASQIHQLQQGPSPEEIAKVSAMLFGPPHDGIGPHPRWNQ